MDLRTALNKAKDQNRKIGLPGVTSWHDIDSLESMRIRPHEALSQEWQLEPRVRNLNEADARLKVKRALSGLMAAADLGRAVEEVLDSLFE